MAEDEEDPGTPDRNRRSITGGVQAGSVRDFFREFAKAEAAREWEGCRVYKVYFSDTNTAIVVCKGLPAIVKKFELTEDQEVTPKFYEIKYPFYQCFRLDMVTAITEVLPGDIIDDQLNDETDPD